MSPHRDVCRRLASISRQLAEMLEDVLDETSKPARKNHTLEAAILDALKPGGTLAPKLLARQAGYPYNSRFRAATTALCRRGLVERTPDGYRLSGGQQEQHRQPTRPALNGNGHAR